MKLALISLDGLDPRVLYNNRDELENFDALMNDTVHGEWKTPGHTIPSYIATLTGHQYREYDFWWDVNHGGFARHKQTRFDFLWEIIDTNMTLLNIPVLYPPQNIDDCMVCGMLAPDNIADENVARPMEAQEMLNDIGYIHEVRADQVFEELGAEGMFDLLCKSMDKRVEAAENLIDMYNSDLFYGVWTATDRWFHRHHTHGVDYWRMYEKADEVLGDMLNLIPDDIPLVVFSDHGFAHFQNDNGVHKGHMYNGWYSIRHKGIPPHRDDTANLFDLFPTVVNYFEGDIPSTVDGRILFHRKDQDEQVKSRLEDLGYL